MFAEKGSRRPLGSMPSKGSRVRDTRQEYVTLPAPEKSVSGPLRTERTTEFTVSAIEESRL